MGRCQKILFCFLGGLAVWFSLVISGKAEEKEDQEIENSPAEIPAKWLEGANRERRKLLELEQRGEPFKLEVSRWHNSDPLKLYQLKGKVVLLVFWDPESPPAIASISYIDSLDQKYREKGLAIIAICTSSGVKQLEHIISKHKIKFPLAVDEEQQTVRAYLVDGYPDYYLIDRKGNLRIADCKNGWVEEAVKQLLAEEP
jgi:cytochrome c biogenesis protein CcmG/thiol:disulfide interchange protein DsbE